MKNLSLAKITFGSIFALFSAITLLAPTAPKPVATTAPSAPAPVVENDYSDLELAPGKINDVKALMASPAPEPNCSVGGQQSAMLRLQRQALENASSVEEYNEIKRAQDEVINGKACI
jgi:hypothetical protein